MDEQVLYLGKKILVILGPTSSGKTDLAIYLAKKFNGELISCDSRQVYKALDIGTGKLPSQNSKITYEKNDNYWLVNGIKIWMYDVADPTKRYDVSKYIKDARKIIEQIVKNQKLPIIVGGTGLYLKALIYGLSNVSTNKKLRKELEKLTLNLLQNKIKEISINKWESLNESDQKNPRRLIRAIELVVLSPKQIEKNINSLVKEYEILKIGLSAPRDILNKRIDARVDQRISEGMIKEAERLNKEGLSFKRMKELGLEYGVLADYLTGKITKNELVKNLKIKIHQYAKRQMTWFKKEHEIFWFDVTEKDWVEKVEKLILDWYN